MHAVTKSIVRLGSGAVLRARCSCGNFEISVARLSTAARRMQDRMIREHVGPMPVDLESPLFTAPSAP